MAWSWSRAWQITRDLAKFYIASQQAKPPAAPPVIPFPTPSLPSNPEYPPAPPVETYDLIGRWGKVVKDIYMHGEPSGLNRRPSDAELLDGCEKVEKYGVTSLIREMYERNGVPYPTPPIEGRVIGRT
jgi:hypothetical protein